jgi:hypothetical protein
LSVDAGPADGGACAGQTGACTIASGSGLHAIAAYQSTPTSTVTVAWAASGTPAGMDQLYVCDLSPTGGNCETGPTQVYSGPAISEIAINGSAVYALTSSGVSSSVYLCKSGACSVMAALQAPPHPSLIAVNSQFLVLGGGSAGDAAVPSTLVDLYDAKTGSTYGAITNPAPGFPVALSADEVNLYWATSGASLYTCALTAYPSCLGSPDGSVGSGVEQLPTDAQVQVPPDGSAPHNLASSGQVDEAVYFAGPPPNPPGGTWGLVYSNLGGPAFYNLLIQSQGMAFDPSDHALYSLGLVQDGAHYGILACTGQCTLSQSPAPGFFPTRDTLAEMAAAGGWVFWFDVTTGAVMRAKGI